MSLMLYNGAASCTRFIFLFFSVIPKWAAGGVFNGVSQYHHPRVFAIDFNLKSKTRWECRMEFVWLMCTRSHDTTRNRVSVRMTPFFPKDLCGSFFPFFFHSLAWFCKKQTETKAMYQKLQMANAFASHMNHLDIDMHYQDLLRCIRALSLRRALHGENILNIVLVFFSFYLCYFAWRWT